MKKSILNLCITQAIKRLKDHPEFFNYPHWTFIIKDNQIISYGINKNEIPNKVLGYQQRIKDVFFKPKLHSEIDAIKRAKNRIKNCEWEAVNIRLNRSGQTRLSCPCSICYGWLWSFGCVRLYFTTPNGWGKIKF